MGSHPLNLALRFLLEIIALLIAGIWGWNQGNGIFGYIYALGLPLLLSAIWGTFNVLNDPSRSGKAPVKVRGWIRLLLELLFFSAACLMLFDMEHKPFYLIFGAIVAIHYLFSFDRIAWLLKQK